MAQTQSKLLNKKSAHSKWAKPDRLGLRGFVKDPNYRYRLIKASDSQAFLSGQDARGWEIVRKGAGAQDLPDTFTGNISQFSREALGSIMKVGDLILARMPEETAQERNSYYAQRTKMESQKNGKDRVDANLRNKMLSEEDIDPSLKPVKGQIVNY